MALQTFDTFEDAAADVPDGYEVAGTYRAVPDEEYGPRVYFHAPATAGRVTMSLLAYEAAHGEPHPDPAFVEYLAREAVSA